MTKEEYLLLLKDPRWKYKKKCVLERDKYKCVKCGGVGILHVHHLKYTGIYPWQAPYKDLITLCKRCHEKIHKIKVEKKKKRVVYGISGKLIKTK